MPVVFLVFTVSHVIGGSIVPLTPSQLNGVVSWQGDVTDQRRGLGKFTCLLLFGLKSRFKTGSRGGNIGVFGSIIKHGGSTLIGDSQGDVFPTGWLVLVLFGSWQRHRGLLTGWIPEAKLTRAAFDSPVGRNDWKGSGGKRQSQASIT